ncbi:MAG: hypothetical protein A2X59_07680 [Nitrospirae bacterium GWC2_42_7]|nr:MAG: hypothetical protein A2X59_07680 [Nitrospirae bacterium GWC2_42_7]
MKAEISATLKTESAEDAQKLLNRVFEGLLKDGLIENYTFEIETGAAVITEKCIFFKGNVIA